MTTLIITIDGQRYRLSRRGHSVRAVCDCGDVFHGWAARIWAIEGSYPLAFVSSPTLLEGLAEAWVVLHGEGVQS